MAKSAKSRSHEESQDIDMDNPEQSEQKTAWQERQRMIAEAAYFRALNRGFQGGDPFDDWCAAETEISVLLRADDSGGGEERNRKGN